MYKYALFSVLLLLVAVVHCRAQFGGLRLIAHRGGIVDAQTDENSISSIKKAADRGYWMVELDVRMTKDAVLVVQHDNDLKRFFNLDKKVDACSWNELKSFRSANGHQVQQLKTMLALLKQEGLQVMIDLKIRGHHPKVFQELYGMVKNAGLAEQALIIPTAEATDYFRGRIKLSCSREQIEAYQKRKDYHPEHYYLFANPSADDFSWAKENQIQVVGAINDFRAAPQELQLTAKKLIELGVSYIQLDSKFDHFFGQHLVPAKDSLSFQKK
ncbi:hypothetical protein HX021_00255 [Sphingobacterium sp. N143]|uniref:glycerophosphodiester phosphodiesterase n=1 Tax=Sphingobacterium sp. N143 TaxID=2746727 RepID=UPI002577685D|nr:glycerophosphodiester phosphodiesterase family protein [Sphingobacterium sp. N143]MDM1292724.1 hypothetical protein [Sphingobacterium sp. N143]